jgi:alkanesulfonate monooxygenase SsuD/methylene tetrahydromethanopterin reductase-like flavin-dependent oxidoreductase (luciferase family)
MQFGAHLPLIDFDGSGYSLKSLVTYTEAARELGYTAIAANDHMLFSRPWLDGLTALTAVMSASGELTLMTSLALPVIRGPVQTAKALAAIDLLSGGRLVAGIGPGSSRADYEAVGLDFEERWRRLDDAMKTLRALWAGESYRGSFHSTQGINLEPRPAQSGGPPLWLGSWGSAAGLRRTARLADGWFASAYNTTPDDFRAAWQHLRDLLRAAGKEPASFPNGLATMWTFVTDSKAEEQRTIDALARMLNRSPDELSVRLTIGHPEHCAGILRSYRDAGVQRLLLWPLADAAHQLEVFRTRVQPLTET